MKRGVQPLALRNAKRCLARTRRGTECQSPAMSNGRCRIHGGLSTGAGRGNQNALKHGYYTAEAVAVRKLLKAMQRQLRELGS